MTSRKANYRKNFSKQDKHGNGSGSEDEFIVFGFAATLQDPREKIATCYQPFDESKQLIPWNGDEALKIDRYDVRLYLTSLDEFDDANRLAIKKRQQQELAGDEEADSAEKLEEELCDEERYLDMYLDMRKQEELDEIEERREKRAEICFSYDEEQEKLDDKEEEEEIEEETEEDEPYKRPDSLKLPVGILTPDTMRQNALIERTAQFVVARGPQMEVVIKAKQRHNAEQFGFLDFDHRLHSYYKYICKLLREKKYTPTPPQIKRRKAKSPTPSESGSDSEDGDGYLHPLLQGGSAAKAAIPSPAPDFIGPSPKPPTQRQPRKPESPSPDLDALVQQFHRTANENSLYSSLFKGLHSVLPGKEEEESGDAQTGGTSDKKAELKAEEEQGKPLFETDQHRINDYNQWHLEFYGRPSPYLPGPPLQPQPPMPDSAVESGITVAAKYVALHGASAEQKLIEHNGSKVHFLLPRSPYYTFYQTRVRQIQWQLIQQHQQNQQMRAGILPVPSPPQFRTHQESSTPVAVSLIKQHFSHSSTDQPRIPTELLVEGKTTKNGGQENGDGAEGNDVDLKQLERKEKARLFMERILNERMAEKHKKTKMAAEQTANDTKTSTEPPMEVEESAAPATSTAFAPPISPYQLSKAISTLIDQQLQKTLLTTGRSPATENKRDRRSDDDSEDEERQKSRAKRHRESKHKGRDYDDVHSGEDRRRRRRHESKRRREDRSMSSDRHRRRRRSRSKSSSRSSTRRKSSRT